MKDNSKRTDSSRSTELTDTGCKNSGIRNTKSKDSGAKLVVIIGKPYRKNILKTSAGTPRSPC